MKPGSAVRAPQLIGRFAIERELGRGAQGTVFLARDSHLGRNVALKTVKVDGYGAARRAELVRMLLDEARIVSKLQHPNLVTLFDAGEHDGAPYLVFEYVEGITLARRLRDGDRLSPPQAVVIAIGALRGLGCAHAMHVLHRDVKPGNIMLTGDGVPRVMDFGIARHAAAGKEADGTLAGTPWYMAPEYIQDGSFSPASDVFAMGAVLYEMLADRPPVNFADPQQALHAIVHDEFAPPSRFNPEVDARLEMLVMQALAKRPEDRFVNADHMAEALDRYMAPPPSGEAGEAVGGTLEFLLRRMRRQSDFPALSETVSAINRITVSDREPVSTLCNAILKDVALTTKLLKLVNTAYYKQHGGDIRTVSRAIAILGLDNVRNIATSLLLFEHLQDRAQAGALREEVAACYFSGVIARELVATLGVKHAEEAFICGMFHRLGRLLVVFYLREEHDAIGRLALARDWDEARAAREVLGLGYEDLGMGVARHWNFPDTLVDSMRPVVEDVARRSAFSDDGLRVIASLASELCDTARAATPKERSAGLEAVTRKYGKGVGVSEAGVLEVVQTSFDALARESVVIGATAAIAPVLAHARNWKSPDDPPTQRLSPPAEDAIRTLIDAVQLPAAAAAAPAEAGAIAPPGERATLLSAGVQDITGVLAGDYQLNDVLRIILETMYRAIGFQRVLLCVRDPQRNALRARVGLGRDADAIIRAGFGVPLQGPPDIFSAATANGADLCIEDVDAENIRAHVPAWYRKAIPARGLVLFPLLLKGRTVGLLYGDTERTDSLRFKTEELNLLRTLRNQAVLAIKQAS